MLTNGCGPNGEVLSRTGVGVGGLGTGTQTAGVEATVLEATSAGAGRGTGRGGRELSAVHPIDNNMAEIIGPSFTLSIS
jgi:hypothetical protein